MTEQEIKDILQQQNHFFSSGKTIPAEFPSETVRKFERGYDPP
mgnify:CR=1 FL=1